MTVPQLSPPQLSPPQRTIVQRLALGLSLSGLGVRQDFLQLARLGLVTGNRDYPQLTDAGFAYLHAMRPDRMQGPFAAR